MIHPKKSGALNSLCNFSRLKAVVFSFTLPAAFFLMTGCDKKTADDLAKPDAKATAGVKPGLGESAKAKPEKTQLKFGFIKLTDCALIVIAEEFGYFEDEGLFVDIEAQANWKILLDRVITGEFDGMHMLAGHRRILYVEPPAPKVFPASVL